MKKQLGCYVPFWNKKIGECGKNICYFLYNFFFYSFVSLATIQFTKLTDQLQSPWSLTSLGKDRYVITEKSGKFILFDKLNNRKTII